MMRLPTSKAKLRGHVLFWLFNYFYLFDYYFEDDWLNDLWRTLPEFLLYLVVAYVNYWLLLPRFLSPKKYGQFVLACLALVSLCGLVVYWVGLDDVIFSHEGTWRNAYSLFVSTTWYLLISTLYWYFERYLRERERQLTLRAEKLEAELQFLRTQISPHFLFNALNNIYALSLQKHENAPAMVASLSKLMRYVLTDSQAARVPLEQEIEVLRQYVDLFLMGKPRSENVDFYVEGELGQWTIAPLLLVNFVENCLKHANLTQDEQAWAAIQLSVDESGKLLFSTENSCPPENLPSNERTGIGLQNARRQLELNYPGKHRLEFGTRDGVFALQLEIGL